MIVAELLDALAHVPDLRDAAGRGHPELFDVAEGHDPAVTAAQAICAACPVLADCRARPACPNWRGRPATAAAEYMAAPAAGGVCASAATAP